MLPTLISQDAEVLGGIPVFVGTRVPIQTLFDYLTTGETLDEFLDDFPTVTRGQAVRLLETAGAVVIAYAHEDSD
ncbi:MAG: DUF433 domain-containing protein [Anaerolineae bacterium]|nr:DUF433 domain-containing protein [Anaerolineae bacterium]